nr:uncharacterized protein LOC111749203 [Loxodonta africana]
MRPVLSSPGPGEPLRGPGVCGQLSGTSSIQIPLRAGVLCALGLGGLGSHGKEAMIFQGPGLNEPEWRSLLKGPRFQPKGPAPLSPGLLTGLHALPPLALVLRLLQPGLPLQPVQLVPQPLQFFSLLLQLLLQAPADHSLLPHLPLFGGHQAMPGQLVSASGSALDLAWQPPLQQLFKEDPAAEALAHTMLRVRNQGLPGLEHAAAGHAAEAALMGHQPLQGGCAGSLPILLPLVGGLGNTGLGPLLPGLQGADQGFSVGQTGGRADGALLRELSLKDLGHLAHGGKGGFGLPGDRHPLDRAHLGEICAPDPSLSWGSPIAGGMRSLLGAR